MPIVYTGGTPNIGEYTIEGVEVEQTDISFTVLKRDFILAHQASWAYQSQAAGNGTFRPMTPEQIAKSPRARPRKMLRVKF